MQISVRSKLTAGLAAATVVGATVLAPVGSVGAHAVAVPPPVVAEFTLTALTVSYSDLVGLLQTLGLGGVIPDISGLLPADFVNAIATEFISQAIPLVTSAVSSLLGYVGTAISDLVIGPNSIPVRFGTALGGIPTVVISAVQSLGTGDVPTALETLSTGLVAPITSIGQAVAEAGQNLQAYLTAQINGLVGALPVTFLAAVQSVIGNNVQSVLDSIRNAISALTGGLIPPAASVSAAPGLAAARVAAPALSVDVLEAVTASPVRQAESDAAPTVRDVVGRSAPAVAQTAAAGDVADQPDVPVRPRVRQAVRPPVALPAAGVAVRSAPSPRQRAVVTPRKAESGPAESGPAESGPAESSPAESGPAESGPGGADVS
ncbi:MAG: hypothetical protein NT156_00240 [Mycobacterium sp.]|nr:hypothetical protein [Mycobacterium sp.]